MVVLGGSAFRHFVVRNVRNLAEQARHFVLCLVHLLLQLLVGLLHLGHAGLDGFGLILLALLHQRANLCGHFLCLAQVLVQLLLGLAPLSVDSHHLFNGLAGSFEMFFLQAADYALGLLCNEF